ncbi:MAG: SpaH/EbpB family LPXTG-anchored major pilin [Firmicutes bacterium]|nr:SpaH/EbpB family LPXTG-anchored major pilin [Bacillota bacterium]
MKKIKNLLPILIAGIMVMALSATAFAAGDGSITVNGTTSGKSYEIYKIFDLTKSSGDSVSYTIDDDWTDFFFDGSGDLTTNGTKYLLTSQPAGESYTQIVYAGTVYYVKITDSNVANFANDAQEYAGSKAPDDSKTATGDSVVFDDIPLGYYLVLPVDATEIKEGNSSICSITNAAPDGEVNIKGEYPDIDKTVDDDDVEVGQEVTYTITGEVPDTTGYDTFTYKVHDTMDSGLTFGTTAATTNFTVEFGEATIYDSSTSLPDGMTLNFDNNGFVLNFDMVKFQNYKGQPITISYNAVVNDEAVCQLTENDAYLEYGHDPDELEETTHKEIPVYSSKIVINKYDGNNTENKLAEAKFVLYKVVDGAKHYYKYTAASGTTPAKVEWVEEVTAGVIPTGATEVETNTDGEATFSGLEGGEYWLHETESPDGYNLLTADTKVTVTAPTYVDEKPIGVSVTADVPNNSGSTLPETGGMGTRIFYIIGAALIAGAGITLFVRKRISDEK